jgi:hypothetical protein
MALLKQWNGTNWVEVAVETTPVLVHDTPQDGATAAAISSNWAFDLAASLGTAAVAATTDFATAAQGGLADTAPQLVAVPATATAVGIAGQLAYADGFLYVCIAENTWQRAILATW